MKKRQWCEISNEAMSEEAIRVLHAPIEDYRISPNSYEKHTPFLSTYSVPVTLYCLAGRCKYTLGDEEVILQASEFLELEAGKYWVEITDDELVKYVMVALLPEPLRKSKKQ